MTVEIRRGTARFVEREAGRQTRHAFSFGPDYDPERVAFGPLVCHDDHLLGPGRGFDTHRHGDLEIVTWVVSGALRHVDSWGAESVVQPGSVAVLSTGPSGGAGGVEHSEHATDDGPCRFVQMWLRSADGDDAAGSGQEPGYAVGPVDLPANRPVPIAQPRPDAVLWAVRLDGTAALPVELPTAPSVYAYVVTGALLRSSLAQPLAAGDAFAMTDEPAHTVAAGVPTDLLVWTFHDGPAPVLMSGVGGGAYWSAQPDDRTPEQQRADEAKDFETPPEGPLRLMGDYGGAFLWDERGNIGGGPDDFAYLHRHLGLSRALYDDLARWGEDWDSRSHTPEHAARGRALHARLQAECPAYEIELRV